MRTACNLINQMWDVLLWQWWKTGKRVVYPDLAYPGDVERLEDAKVTFADEPKVHRMAVLVDVDGQVFRFQVEEVTEGGPKGLLDPTSPAHEIVGKPCEGEGCPYCRMGAIGGLTGG